MFLKYTCVHGENVLVVSCDGDGSPYSRISIVGVPCSLILLRSKVR